ncbi:MAG: hypothetical protein JRM99_01420 [Nitrososphaerota archaeon]|nr:hypothetical protein [Nitrososphaerota archaeon]
MTKKLLSPAEIQHLVLLLRDVFAYISDLKAKNPLAAYIQYPKLPPVLTESLAIHLLRKGEINGLSRYEFQFGGEEADIIGRDAKTKLHIEVKGTTKGFEYFGDKDIHSDYLLWFDFEDLLRKNRSDDHLRLYVIAHPGDHFDKPLKIVISRLKQVARSDVISHDYKLSSLLERLAAGGASQSQGRRIEHWT